LFLVFVLLAMLLYVSLIIYQGQRLNPTMLLPMKMRYLNISKLGAVCSTYLPNYYGEMRVVDVHIGHIRQKIREDFITTVRGVGYRFEDKVV